tara:strand:- start:2 stop:415 length:414 start_codon:yes stop_codon:yes gene_type:complete
MDCVLSDSIIYPFSNYSEKIILDMTSDKLVIFLSDEFINKINYKKILLSILKREIGSINKIELNWEQEFINMNKVEQKNIINYILKLQYNQTITKLSPTKLFNIVTKQRIHREIFITILSRIMTLDKQLYNKQLHNK